MRPHLLELKAFGPFSESEWVDFDQLADAGLFLLHGDTGAGKTTLLDAISFALYGSVPGARGKSPRLRSDHAAPSVSPEVRLEFSVGERRWRITRQPSWRRPKQRGTGTTEAKASVLLERWAEGAWETVSTRFEEAGEEIKNAVGMTAEQFCQVVLLPQGGFAQFLHVGVDERADLLQRLFGTERFERVERWLKQRATELGAQLREEQQHIRELEAKIRQVGGIDAQDLADREISASVARTLMAHAQAGAERARLAADTAHSDWGQRKDEHAALVARAEKASARHKILAEIERLTAEKPRIEAIAQELQQAQRATAVRPMVAALAQADVELEQAVLVESHAREALRETNPDAADLDVDRLAELTREEQQRVGSLEALRPTADELNVALERARRAEREAVDHQCAIDAAEGRLTELATLLVEAQENLRAAQAASVEVETYRATAKELAHVERRMTDFAEASAAVTALTARRDETRTMTQDVRDIFQERRQTYLDGLAARLAAQLSEGDPCPVCGSLEHPIPAAPQAISVDDQQLAEFETSYENARRSLNDVELELAAAQQRKESAEADLEISGYGQLGPAAIEARSRETSVSLLAAENLANDLANAETTFAALQQEQLHIQQKLAEHRAAGIAARSTARQEVARGDALQSALNEHLGEHTDFASAIAAHVATAAALTATATAAAERARCQASATNARNAAERGAQQAGFTNLEAGAAAIRDEETLARLETIRTEHDRAFAAAQARLDDLAEDTLNLTDIAAAQELSRIAMQEAETVFQQQFTQQALAENRYEALVELVPALEEALTAHAPRIAEFETVRGLADLVVGDGANHRKMALSSYVLAARLEEVAAAASERLLRMTNSRYALLHSDTAPDARKRWGLGLRVRDAWTGEDRETGTLSGGETFLASLALALGLADVVTAEAGGSRIDTLFIDEGFGTLDENTLEDVLTVLDGLREGGRMVGLVSHVGELKQRIPTQLEVLKTSTGSTLRRAADRAA